MLRGVNPESVRRATESDLPKIVALNRVIQQLHHDSRPDWFKPVDPAGFLSIARRWLHSSDAAVFVAEDDDEVIGYAAAVRSERPDHPLVYAATYVELDQLVVAPAHRGHGVGSALCEQVIAWSECEGMERIEVATWGPP